MAPRTPEVEAWFATVYSAVCKIPSGKVTSYGHIAQLVGEPQRSRQVGVCLKHLPTDTSLRFHNGNVPWQRVINYKGCISPRGPGGAANQAVALQQEGVRVDQSAMGEYVVDFDQYGWFPNRLPSDAATASDSDERDNESGDNDEEEAS